MFIISAGGFIFLPFQPHPRGQDKGGVNMISRAATWIKAKLPYIIMVAMVLGLLNGYYNQVDYLKAFITPVLFLMIYPMMINLDIEEVFEHLSNPKPLLWSLGINFIISPLIAYLLSKLFLTNNPELMIGLILISVIPTSGMTASWTGLAKGNMNSALVMISGNLLVAILLIPLYLNLLLGKMVAIKTIMIVKSLIKVVVVPLILGDLTRRWIINKYGEDTFVDIKPDFGGASSLGVALIVFIALSLKSKTILADLHLVLIALLPLGIYYLLMLFFSANIGCKCLDEDNKIALVYGTEMRNLTVALGLALSTFGGLAVFLISLAYVIQVPSGAFYMHYVKQ